MASGRWASSGRRSTLPPDWIKIRKRILRRDKWCTLCRADLSREVDHIRPSGPDTDDNLRGVCTVCHRRKSAHEGARASGQARRARSAARNREPERHPGLLD